jgi:exodeoxyribonuclease X
MSHKTDFLKQCMVLDTETTGKDYKTAEIIEAGFVILDENGNDWVIYQELHKPLSGEIPAQVKAICYIVDEMVADCPAFIDAKETFENVVKSFNTGYLVAHNHFYDMRVLQNHGVDTTEYNWLCTWRIAKKLFETVAEIEETNLPYLRFKLELDVPLTMYCHRAGNDSYITAKLLEVLVEYMEGLGLLNLEEPYGPQIMLWAAEPIIYTKMPFGKHKGEDMKNVPPSYWNWAMKNMDSLNEEADNYDPDLAASIAIALER